MSLFGCAINANKLKQDKSQKYEISNDGSGGIRPWSENPSYWEYKNKPTLLLGAFNYGHNPFIEGSALDTINKENLGYIIAQIDEMVKAGGNVLRCVLDPGSATVKGIDAYKKDSSGKFNLNFPEGEYWDKLSTFISEAEKRDVIVELEIWDRFDWQGKNWEFGPFNPLNNINYTVKNTNLKDTYELREVYRNHKMAIGVPNHPAYDSANAETKEKYDLVRKYQEIFVSKVFDVGKTHSNVLYNISNETAEHPAWGEYWIKYLKRLAAKENKKIVSTNMQDGIYHLEESAELKHQIEHPEIYDYLDISQINSRLRDEEHWQAVDWIVNSAYEKAILFNMIKLYGSDDVDFGPWNLWKPGDSDNAIEEWWRNLIAGVAGVRFHRPTAGIGLSEKAKACIAATRKIESKVKFWDVKPEMGLLSDRDFDEAYLAASPGEKYILYFTHQGAGSVGLDLKEYKGDTFTINWVNVDTGKWGHETSVNGGSVQKIDRPDNSAHWVATIVKK